MSGTDVVRSSAWMALGTIVSRLTGFVRLALIAAAIGKSLNADIFNNANTLPNALYILVAGGIFNVVLVPQLVRAMKNDEDGGDAYANRVVTLGLLVLLAATVVLTLLVPLLVRGFFASAFQDPIFAEQRADAVLLMSLCMPQVFFYGAFVLVGQILNARGRFGPMMWAPIVNNLASVVMLGTYIAMFGSSNAADGFSRGEVLLLGLGSTAGIALQFLVLVPYLRAAGFRYRPRFDFRGVGLGHTLRLGAWTLGFIVANQVAFVVVNKIATRSTTGAARNGGEAAGSAVYEIGFLVSQVPHGIITVSLATAMMPTLASLAADGRLDRMRLEVSRTLRIALVIILPVAVLTACLGTEVAAAMTSWGALAGDTAVIGHTLQAFAPAMVLFTVHYLMLRGFYATENTRTPFFVQVVISAVNVVVALLLTASVADGRISTMLALSYGAAYLVGATVSTTLLSRRVGRVLDREMLVYAAKMLVVCAATAAVALGVDRGLGAAGLDQERVPGALLTVVVGAGLAGLAYLASARLLRLDELTHLLRSVLRRG